ncbi:MAG: 23S rRNA pseudouridine(1911/1915/1917) synthase RluD [Gammaproteobacteria bacterium]|jgi:23S rRNA pseudouridine1911/1915/1917 synthase|nr:23S rRNA pseudouridine(1911/1915/1917) synthase RluD [Gammaproteobacteria bacterium]MBU0769837.1 23S rRNA pseudouridine(1911/1915/1917) synthase RluD [Gammaproteobacteria bacterium]MBU0856450.1 23S rRNA pseudouridine(1911/1915/1917) synthase RluD [Gammaproteobacteria bacterium]MBU1847489.1 23S rRNA pseudouridine(1911/1915/1917) synthase RluD [Gammaproteobacteria bacterium]
MTLPTLEETQDDDYIAERAADRLHAVVPPGIVGERLDTVLARVWPQYSRSRLQGWLREGRVSVDERVCDDARRRTYTGERLGLEPAPAPADTVHAPQDIALDVVFEDDTLLVINKPAGMVVHPGNGVPDGTLLNALLHHAPALARVPRAGIVHRLDKDTTGLLVVARTVEAQTDLVRQLQARTVSRRYVAVVAGDLRTDGVVDAAIGRHPVQRTRMAVVAGGKPARTHYAVREYLQGATRVECRLETGRTHQIRVHMASIGHSLLGDETYAPRQVADAFTRQALHAWRLGLVHPLSGAEVSWEVALPDDMARLIECLRVMP